MSEPIREITRDELKDLIWEHIQFMDEPELLDWLVNVFRAWHFDSYPIFEAPKLSDIFARMMITGKIND